MHYILDFMSKKILHWNEFGFSLDLHVTQRWLYISFVVYLTIDGIVNNLIKENIVYKWNIIKVEKAAEEEKKTFHPFSCGFMKKSI